MLMPPDEDFSFPTLSEPSTSSPPQMEVAGQSAVHRPPAVAQSLCSPLSGVQNPLMQRATVKHANAAAAPQAVQVTRLRKGDHSWHFTLTWSDASWAHTDATAKAQAAAEVAHGKGLQSDGLDAHS